ncbi:TPA: recombinase family protein, partial [Citrobacter freundii]|nr:recombinase family protein [Citrobacter freundii]
KLEKSTNLDGALLIERDTIKLKIQELNNMLLTESKIPTSVIQTINNLEDKLHELEEKIKKQNSMIISERAFDLNLLQEIKDPQELNMMLKRVIEQITVYNIGKKWRIKVLYRNKHVQSFLWDGEKISFITDTKEILDLVNSWV